MFLHRKRKLQNSFIFGRKYCGKQNPLINESARNGNLYLFEYYAQKNQIPKIILIFSAKSKNYELIKLLLGQKCFDINDIDDDGWTALILASVKGHTEIVKLLLEQ